MSEKFHAELRTLKEDTVNMALLGRLMLRTAVDALIRQDTELAKSVIDKKEEIREKGVRIEERCYQLIALNQPMAKDMRTIACTLKMTEASLRIGRYGKSIANIVRELSGRPHIANMMSLPHMADLVTDMVDDAIKAYASDSISRVSDFPSRDDTIDALRHSIFREGISYMMEDPKNIPRCTHYIMVARYLERCADHACSVAENVHYMQTGERIDIH